MLLGLIDFHPELLFVARDVVFGDLVVFIFGLEGGGQD